MNVLISILATIGAVVVLNVLLVAGWTIFRRWNDEDHPSSRD